MLDQPVQRAATSPIAEVSDERLAVFLDWIIVRNGPGSWSSNADWDEYLIRIQNISEQPIRVTRVVVVDSQRVEIELRSTRRELVAGSQETIRRYEDQGLDAHAGAGGEALLATGLGVGGASLAIGYAAAAGSSAALGAAGAAVAGVIAAPVLIFGGIIENDNNKEVDAEILNRQSLLPAVLPPRHGKSLNLFFPLAPSPVLIVFTYSNYQGEYEISVDTKELLDGLHIRKTEP